MTVAGFNEAFEEAPLVVASPTSCNGADISIPRIGSVGAGGFTAMALEDQSFDLETDHGCEIIDWMALSAQGGIFAGAPAPPPLQAGDRGVAVSFGAAFEPPRGDRDGLRRGGAGNRRPGRGARAWPGSGRRRARASRHRPSRPALRPAPQC